jgi:hypothetical protein
MSQLKVSSIVDTAGGNTVTINGATPTVNNTMGRNRIINGDMRIDQRNAGASITPTNGQYATDRWKMYVSQSSKLTAQQSTTAPAGFTNSLLITSSSAYSIGSGDLFAIAQMIEGVNTYDLGFGSASAKTVTVSFWVRSSLTGTFGGSLTNSAYDRSYPFTYTISSANTWEQKSVTIAGDTSGTWLTNTSAGIRVWFSLGVGSTYSGTAGSWAATEYESATGATSVVGTNGATWYITGVQLEVGSVATEFERRPYGTELALCQRYYEKSFESETAPSTSAVNNSGNVATSNHAYHYPVNPTRNFSVCTAFKVTKRSAPTVVTYSQSATGAIVGHVFGSGYTSLSFSINAAGQNFFTGESSGTSYNELIMGWTASAEL